MLIQIPVMLKPECIVGPLQTLHPALVRDFYLAIGAIYRVSEQDDFESETSRLCLDAAKQEMASRGLTPDLAGTGVKALAVFGMNVEAEIRELAFKSKPIAFVQMFNRFLEIAGIRIIDRCVVLMNEFSVWTLYGNDFRVAIDRGRNLVDYLSGEEVTFITVEGCNLTFLQTMKILIRMFFRFGPRYYLAVDNLIHVPEEDRFASVWSVIESARSQV